MRRKHALRIYTHTTYFYEAARMHRWIDGLAAEVPPERKGYQCLSLLRREMLKPDCDLQSPVAPEGEADRQRR